MILMNWGKPSFLLYLHFIPYHLVQTHLTAWFHRRIWAAGIPDAGHWWMEGHLQLPPHRWGTISPSHPKYGLELIDETRTLKRGFIPVALMLISPARNVTHLHLRVSQVTGVSWRAGLSARSPWSWWLCFASTSECSAVDDFTSWTETLPFFFCSGQHQ